MRKRLLQWVFALTVLLPCLLLTAAAEERTVTASGYCGGEGDGINLTWTLYADGELVISGNGGMKDYSSSTVPWHSYRSDIITVTIEDGVTSIGNDAFACCYSLTSATIGDSVTSIGNYAFVCCYSLSSVTIGNSVTAIGMGAFSSCKSLTSVTIPDGVTSISFGMFNWCTGLTNMTIPDSVTIIGGDAFYYCTGLTSVTIGNSVTSIGAGAFCGCTGLTSVTIPDSVTSIDDSAFIGCTGLTSVTIPDSVTSIEYDTFSGCESLASVTIPDSVTNIGTSAFSGCTSLTKIEFLGNAPSSVESYVFDDCDNLTIYYYEGTTGWPTTGTWQGRPLEMLYNVENYKPAGMVPERKDHIFAGWYDDKDHKTIHKEHGGNAHAKFVHKDVFRVKGQVSAGTTAQSEVTDIRFVTTVDCLNYKKVGFKITFGGKTVTQETNTVYSSIVSNTDGVGVDYAPADAFHADSRYFVTMVLKDIPNEHFNDTFTVTPYWVTQDGTTVEGVTNELRISMGF